MIGVGAVSDVDEQCTQFVFRSAVERAGQQLGLDAEVQRRVAAQPVDGQAAGEFGETGLACKAVELAGNLLVSLETWLDACPEMRFPVQVVIEQRAFKVSVILIPYRDSG